MIYRFVLETAIYYFPPLPLNSRAHKQNMKHTILSLSIALTPQYLFSENRTLSKWTSNYHVVLVHSMHASTLFFAIIRTLACTNIICWMLNQKTLIWRVSNQSWKQVLTKAFIIELVVLFHTPFKEIEMNLYEAQNHYLADSLQKI